MFGEAIDLCVAQREDSEQRRLEFEKASSEIGCAVLDNTLEVV